MDWEKSARAACAGARRRSPLGKAAAVLTRARARLVSLGSFVRSRMRPERVSHIDIVPIFDMKAPMLLVECTSTRARACGALIKADWLRRHHSKFFAAMQIQLNQMLKMQGVVAEIDPEVEIKDAEAKKPEQPDPRSPGVIRMAGGED